MKIRCGDIVFHRPTRERWLVAWAHGHELAPAGWPGGIARIKDCQIVRRCTDEEHEKEVACWLSLREDPRLSKIRELYSHVILSGTNAPRSAEPAENSDRMHETSSAREGGLP